MDMLLQPGQAQSDGEFCSGILGKVSRTFSLPIAALGSLRMPITAAYLLCRAADEVEDDRKLAETERSARFRSLLAALENPSKETIRAFETHYHQDPEQQKTHEQVLCANLGRVFSLLDQSPTEGRIVRRWTSEMVRGMELYAKRLYSPSTEAGIYSQDDLDRYCYFVAGTVGQMLTDLFCSPLGISPQDVPTSVRSSAEDLARGLQLTNILKDVPKDAKHGISFVSFCHPPPSDRLLPNLAELASVFERAETSLLGSLDFLAWLPEEQTKIRSFVLMPTWMAFETLATLRNSDQYLDRKVSIRREEVLSIVARTPSHAAKQEAVRQLYRTYAGKFGHQGNPLC